MASTIVEILGTVKPDGTLELEQKVGVPPGRVKVRLESVETRTPLQESLVDFVKRTRRELEEAGHKFMTEEEVAALIEDLRADDDGLEKIYEECAQQRRTQEPPA